MRLEQGLHLHNNRFTLHSPKGIGAMSFTNHRWGKCKTCNEYFFGPPNRRYCDTHSDYIHSTGKKTEYERYQQAKEHKKSQA